MVDINLGDADAWDDSALVSSWNEALQEYKKYHSIHVKGQKLSEVLTKDELKLLSSNGIEIDKAASTGEEAQVEEQLGDDDEAMIESEDTSVLQSQSLTDGQQHQSIQVPAADSSGHVPAAVPQVLLNSVKDEGVRNLMMSWYWAGYYTGLHEGQQGAKNEG